VSAWCGQKQSLLGIDEEEDMGGSIATVCAMLCFLFFITPGLVVVAGGVLCMAAQHARCERGKKKRKEKE